MQYSVCHDSPALVIEPPWAFPSTLAMGAARASTLRLVLLDRLAMTDGAVGALEAVCEGERQRLRWTIPEC